ncbi:hypothetical protein J1N35_035408 [Gossypium stocksii]|uniref:Uncharacterized protein n=1 Tax=Gossypium stocksii TaxID=47602 RepID=A0A9D3UU03_9ROSI|nr:hypothetical protein J1N35_035408 [Gossypium stocksii]
MLSIFCGCSGKVGIGEHSSLWAYYLDAFSSYMLRTWLPSVYRGYNNWYTRGKDSLNALTPTTDMNRTVPRHSEPNSRIALMGEQR